jgi:AcrR family transcriptional regulator
MEYNNKRTFVHNWSEQMTETTTLTKGALTRIAILDAAERLILSQGYHGTSMRQIANETGIAVGGIYNHFAGKEAIFAALLERHQPYSDIANGLAAVSGENVTELVEGAARVVIDELMEDPVFIRLSFIDLQEFDGDTLFRVATQMIQGMLTFVDRLVEAGWVRQDIPLPVLVRSFAGLIGFFVLSEIVAFGGDSPRFVVPFDGEIDWIGGMTEIYLNGVLKRE